jgi:hypothetical protein
MHGMNNTILANKGSRSVPQVLHANSIECLYHTTTFRYFENQIFANFLKSIVKSYKTLQASLNRRE